MREYFKSTDINILKKFFLIQIRPKLNYATSLVSLIKKDINHIEYVHRKYTTAAIFLYG